MPSCDKILSAFEARLKGGKRMASSGVVLTCPCCGRKFEVGMADLEVIYRNKGIVPIFCTLECEIRYSGKS